MASDDPAARHGPAVPPPGDETARYRALLDALDEGYLLGEVILDEQGRCLDIEFAESNPAAARMVGVDLAGRRLREIDPAYEEYWFEVWGRVARTGHGERLELYASRDRRWYDFYLFKVEPHHAASRRVAVIFRDVTSRRRRQAGTALLAELSAHFARLTTAEELMAAVGAQVAGLLGLSRCWFGEVDDQAGRAVVTHDWHVSGLAGLTTVGELAGTLLGECLLAAAYTGEPVVLHDTARQRPGLPGTPGVQALVVAPVAVAERPRLVVGVASADPRDWRSDEADLVRTLAQAVWPRLQRIRAEAALRESEARHRLIIEGARDYAILTLDPQGRITSWSPGAEAVFGWRSDEIVGRHVALTFTPEDQAAGAPEDELAIARRDGTAPDVRWHLRHDGARVFIAGTTRALTDSEGVLHGFLKIGQDVTGRRQTEEALHQSDQRFRALVEAAAQAVWETDAEGVVVADSPSWRTYTGQRLEEWLGDRRLNAIHPEDRARVEALWRDGVPAG